MSEGTFESLGESVQGNMKEAAGDGELEAEGARQQAEADRVEQDETETDADGGV